MFRDPRNAFRGLKNYKTIFWSLRFHGRLFFKVLYVDVQRLWQPDDQQIKYGLSASDVKFCLIYQLCSNVQSTCSCFCI